MRQRNKINVVEIIVSILDTVIKIAIFVFLANIIYRGALMAYDYGFRVFTEAPVSIGEGRIISVEVKKDMDSRALGEMLQKKGLIRDSRIFFFQELLSEYRGKEVPGIYDLSTAMTAEEMLEVISQEVEEEEEEEITPIAQQTEEELYIPEDDEAEGEGAEAEGEAAE